MKGIGKIAAAFVSLASLGACAPTIQQKKADLVIQDTSSVARHEIGLSLRGLEIDQKEVKEKLEDLQETLSQYSNFADRLENGEVWDRSTQQIIANNGLSQIDIMNSAEGFQGDFRAEIDLKFAILEKLLRGTVKDIEGVELSPVQRMQATNIHHDALRLDLRIGRYVETIGLPVIIDEWQLEELPR